MIGAIKHGLRNIFTLDGRDARQTFWYYMLFLYAAGTILSSMAVFLAMAPGFGAIFSTIYADAMAGQHTDPIALQNAMMGGMVDKLVPITIVVGIANMVLAGAALVRRLHDSNLSGAWAFLPGIPYAIHIAATPFILRNFLGAQTAISRAGQMPDDIFGTFALGITLGYAPLIALILLGVRASSPGPNRFGDSPVRF
ncbi:MAG: DUF805 domain-containing protein [Sphingomonadaceae bacterium]|nr:DUF805 domain-containing protein [Sphingomonadaceae bacterium]